MPNLFFVLIVCFVVIGIAYMGLFFVLRSRMVQIEQKMTDLFLQKSSKIPALIEVMRPFVAAQKSFETTIQLHAEAMMQELDSLYALLVLNAKIEREYAFLMKLSVQITELQKNEQFLYIRDFIMQYEREMRNHVARYNTAVGRWNRFIFLKNCTLIGFFLPGSTREKIQL